MIVNIVMSPNKGGLGDQHPSVRHETLWPGQCLFASAADIEARAPDGTEKANAFIEERISALRAEAPSNERDAKIRYFAAAQPTLARITVEPVAR